MLKIMKKMPENCLKEMSWMSKNTRFQWDTHSFRVEIAETEDLHGWSGYTGENNSNINNNPNEINPEYSLEGLMLKH